MAESAETAAYTKIQSIGKGLSKGVGALMSNEGHQIERTGQYSIDTHDPYPKKPGIFDAIENLAIKAEAFLDIKVDSISKAFTTEDAPVIKTELFDSKKQGIIDIQSSVETFSIDPLLHTDLARVARFQTFSKEFDIISNAGLCSRLFGESQILHSHYQRLGLCPLI